ncbi:hypothetical protein CFB82_17715 [Burkholderia sp. HI2714]|uniref:hypothetical protein n=1 Tax=Burkholderia sp. HI2714 TaxID=2015359 RepID=UPI000B7A18D4|nr:hypothetical protein [Burkholderia sp. HI2714]OXJ33011.1 hypothetical protein CFB82_17715 [Burkholderia sp. HI2714]
MAKTSFPISIAGSDGLLLVGADAPIADSLEEASNTLEAALTIITAVANGMEAIPEAQSTLYGALTLIGISKGLADAALVKYGLAKDTEVNHV